MKRFSALFLTLALAIGLVPVRADEQTVAPVDNVVLASLQPKDVTLPSPLPSGLPANDKLVFTYYPPRGVKSIASTNRAPGVILLHHLLLHPMMGSDVSGYMRTAALYASQRGIGAVVIMLPYHGARAVRGIKPVDRFVSKNPTETESAFLQSVADVRAATDWLAARPEIDPQKLGCFGVSLGAIIAHLAMGQDTRLRAGVAMLGGGDIVKLFNESPWIRFVLHRSLKNPTEADLAARRKIDPISYAGSNRPRQVLMIQAARDLIVPPKAGRALWEALGRPPIRWIDTNHFALTFGANSAIRAGIAFLEASWNGATAEEAAAQTPKITVPTLKAGFLVGLDSRATLALQYQALSLGSRRHMAMFSGNVGISGRGPFVGMAATVTDGFDLGLGHRINGGKGVTPYASFHVVF